MWKVGPDYGAVVYFPIKTATPGSVELKDDDTFPKYHLWDDTETETDEPATETITLFDEPTWLFQDIMFRRLYQVTRNFLDGIKAEMVPLLQKTDQLAGGTGDDEDHRKFDHAANLGRGLIGHTWDEINKLSDTTIPVGKRKTHAQVEALVEKVEAVFPDSAAIDKFFIRHDESLWYHVRQNRQIRLVADDYKPGEIVRNINEEHIAKTPPHHVDQAAAETAYAACIKTCFRQAWQDRRDRLRKEIHYSYGWGDTAITFPKSQLTDESTLE